MNIKKAVIYGKEIIIVNSDSIIFSDVQTALDFMASVTYETECSRVALNIEEAVEMLGRI